MCVLTGMGSFCSFVEVAAGTQKESAACRNQTSITASEFIQISHYAVVVTCAVRGFSPKSPAVLLVSSKKFVGRLLSEDVPRSHRTKGTAGGHR